MKTTSFLIAILSLIAAQQLLAENRVALVVGNNDYDDDGKLEDLGACKRDAVLIKQTLEGVGFTVIYGEDLTRTQLDEKLTEFENAIEKGGTAVFYFAGHAIEFDGKNYLLGSNAKLQARSRLGEEAMNAETFATAMLLAGAKSSFLLLDCCRDAPRDSEWLSRGQRKAGLAQIDVDGDIIIGYAAKPGASALEPTEPGSNSPYAEALAKWIPSGLDHGDVFQKVRMEVHNATGGLQRTWENGSFLEPFHFKPGGARPNMAVAVPVPAPLPVPPPAAPAPAPPKPAYPKITNGAVEMAITRMSYIDADITMFATLRNTTASTVWVYAGNPNASRYFDFRDNQSEYQLLGGHLIGDNGDRFRLLGVSGMTMVDGNKDPNSLYRDQNYYIKIEGSDSVSVTLEFGARGTDPYSEIRRVQTLDGVLETRIISGGTKKQVSSRSFSFSGFKVKN
ncbi:MAG: hypothetical protein ACI8UO_005068 [Verrucomicrobiales bacterium]|jgi:hypothetical protein